MASSTYYSAEKKPIVLQFGKCFTKVGFASEPRPRAIFSTPELQSEETMDLGTSTLSGQEWDGILIPLVKRIYFQYLKIVPTDRRMILLEHDLMPTAMRQSISRVLFEKMKVPSIIYMSEMLSPLYSCGIASGIVVDVGYQETRVMPVCFGVPLYRCYQINRIGSETINKNFREMLMTSVKERRKDDEVKRNKEMSLLQHLPEKVLEDIKAKCCYIRFELAVASDSLKDENDEEIKILKESMENGNFVFESKNDLEYPLSSEVSVFVPAKSRWECCECLLNPPLPPPGQPLQDGIVEAIVSAIEGCPLDVKRHVIENLLFCGGGSELNGLQHRVTNDLRNALSKHKTLSPLTNKLAVGNPRFEPVLLQWIGASAAAAACEEGENLANEIALSEWEAGEQLPDWSLLPEMRVVEAETTEAFFGGAKTELTGESATTELTVESARTEVVVESN